MLFSIASAVFGGVIVVLYSMTIASNEDLDWGEIGIKAVLGLGIVEFLIGMWAAVCMWFILKPFKNCCITTGKYSSSMQYYQHSNLQMKMFIVFIIIIIYHFSLHNFESVCTIR